MQRLPSHPTPALSFTAHRRLDAVSPLQCGVLVLLAVPDSVHLLHARPHPQQHVQLRGSPWKRRQGHAVQEALHVRNVLATLARSIENNCFQAACLYS